jgi:3-oxoacyl-[acyl-carrier-protein] synthase III
VINHIISREADAIRKVTQQIYKQPQVKCNSGLQIEVQVRRKFIKNAELEQKKIDLPTVVTMTKQAPRTRSIYPISSTLNLQNNPAADKQ